MYPASHLTAPIGQMLEPLAAITEEQKAAAARLLADARINGRLVEVHNCVKREDWAAEEVAE